MKILCQTSGVKAFRYSPILEPWDPKKDPGFQSHGAWFWRVPTDCQVRSVTVLPQKNNKQTNPWFCVCPFHWVLFSVANQSINQFTGLHF
jgi:hypothetical protein